MRRTVEFMEEAGDKNSGKGQMNKRGKIVEIVDLAWEKRGIGAELVLFRRAGVEIHGDGGRMIRHKQPWNERNWMCGTSVERAWNVRATCVQRAWKMRGRCVEHAWNKLGDEEKTWASYN